MVMKKVLLNLFKTLWAVGEMGSRWLGLLEGLALPSKPVLCLYGLAGLLPYGKGNVGNT